MARISKLAILAGVGLGLACLAWLTTAALAQTKTTKAKSKIAAAAVNNLAAEEAKKGEWSRWRGPNNDGISLETGLLDSWPTDGPPLAWRVKGLGSGYSSVSIAGGKIFTLGKKQGRTNLIARNVADGAPIWETAVGSGGNPNCTPTVDGELVFGLTLGGDLFCCQASDGSLVWSKNYEKDFGGKMMSGWGYSESPLIDGDRLICTPGGDQALLACLNKKTGETIWLAPARQSEIGRRGGDGAGYASVVIGNCGGVKQYITLVGRGVVSADAETGKFLWAYNGVANGTANIPTPIVAGDYVFCSSGYGTGTALLKINGGRSGFECEGSLLPRRQQDAKPSRRHDPERRLRLLRHRPQRRLPLVHRRPQRPGRLATRSRPRERLGRRRLCRRPPLFPLSGRHDGPDRGDPERVSPERHVQDRQQKRRKLAPPRHRRRQALPPRPGRAAVLRYSQAITYVFMSTDN